ncbi:MAG: M12 family metallopeptidase [Phycisphaerales bacterium]
MQFKTLSATLAAACLAPAAFATPASHGQSQALDLPYGHAQALEIIENGEAIHNRSRSLPAGFEGWTREELASLAIFNGDAPGIGTLVSAVNGGKGIYRFFGECRSELPGATGDDMTRGFGNRRIWPRGEIIWDWSQEIKDVFNDGEPPMNLFETFQELAVPNTILVQLLIETVTEERIKFIAYDAAVHEYFVLINANDPEGDCFNVATVGFAANPDGQTYDVCAWDSLGVILHEFGHTMSLYHEHQRFDRDDFIQFNATAVEPGSLSQFQKIDYDPGMVGPYDYGSVMHYSQFAFALPGNLAGPTIELLRGPAFEWLNNNPTVIENLNILFALDTNDPDYEDQLFDALEQAVGNGEGLSDGDIANIFEIYGSPGDPYPWVFDPARACPFDINDDTKQTIVDLVLFLDMINAGSPYADVNGDGVTDYLDFVFFYGFWTPGFCQIDGRPKPPTGRPVIGTGPN